MSLLPNLARWSRLRPTTETLSRWARKLGTSAPRPGSAFGKDMRVEPDFEAPLKFRGSGADKHRPHETFVNHSAYPRSQSFIVSASMGIFALYFFVLREENDIDKHLGKSFIESVPPEFEEEATRLELNAAINAGSGGVPELEARLERLAERRIRKELGLPEEEEKRPPL